MVAEAAQQLGGDARRRMEFSAPYRIELIMLFGQIQTRLGTVRRLRARSSGPIGPES